MGLSKLDEVVFMASTTGWLRRCRVPYLLVCVRYVLLASSLSFGEFIVANVLHVPGTVYVSHLTLYFPTPTPPPPSWLEEQWVNMFTSSERASALKHRRSHVRRPIQRNLLLAMLDNYNSSCGSTHSVGGNGSVSVVTDSATADYFSPDIKSLNAFRAAGGLLLQSPLASKLVDRRYLLCDINFWRFWDIIVMQSGWTMLNTEKFNAAFSAGSIGYIALVRSIPIESSLSWSGSDLVNVAQEAICCASAGYGVFQRGLFKYQLNLLHRMICCQVSVVDILMLVLDLNVILMGFTSHLPVDFDANNLLHRKRLLVEQLECYVNFSCYCDAVSNLRVFCDVECL
eukprot:scaffold4831_cov131-Skeletonema_dohrnii-CCMP3373.AAC.6